MMMLKFILFFLTSSVRLFILISSAPVVLVVLVLVFWVNTATRMSRPVLCGSTLYCVYIIRRMFSPFVQRFAKNRDGFRRCVIIYFKYVYFKVCRRRIGAFAPQWNEILYYDYLLLSIRFRHPIRDVWCAWENMTLDNGVCYRILYTHFVYYINKRAVYSWFGKRA